jgi:hypothetical protein
MRLARRTTILDADHHHEAFRDWRTPQWTANRPHRCRELARCRRQAWPHRLGQRHHLRLCDRVAVREATGEALLARRSIA